MSKRIKKETLPFIVAIIMLILLICALVYTILYKPKDNKKAQGENTLTVEDIIVDNKSTTCGNYNISDLANQAKKVQLSYEVLDDYNFGPATVVDSGEGDEQQNAKGYALKIKASGLTDDMYIKINNKTLDTTTDYYKADIDKTGYVYNDTYNIDLQLLDVKVLINNDECKNIVLREFEVTLPKLNYLVIGGLCEEDAYKGRDVCKPYIFDNDSSETRIEKLKKEKEVVEKEEKEKKEKEDKQIKNNKWIRIVIIASTLIIIAVASVVVMKGSKKHEKK